MRRHRKPKGKPFGRNVQVVAVQAGHTVRTTGIRENGSGLANAPKAAQPIHVGRVYTGINKGKVYPYASKKRGGHAPQS